MDFGKYKAFIFDFDGVIFDTEKYHFSAWNSACAPLGVTISEEEYLPLKSTGRYFIASFVEKKLGRALSNGERESLINFKAREFERYISAISEKDFIPGALDFIKKLNSLGKKTAVGSSGSITKKIIERFNLGGLFNAVVDGSGNLPKKPDPAIFSECARLLGEPPKNCVVFEDSVAGLRAAVAAGMAPVAVGGIIFGQAVYNIKDFKELR